MDTRKRLYVGLLVASLLFLLGAAAAAWYLVAYRELAVNRVILAVIAVAMGGLFMVVAGGILAIVLSILRCEVIPSLDGAMRLANQVLFPVAVFLGKALGIEREQILRSFIAVNNSLVRARKRFIPPRQLMLLVPHCLQDADCPHKITVDIRNCKKCGKCCIKDLVELADRYHATLKVATGGTLARKFVAEVKPRGIVAVACERDLSLGIQDTGVLPVVGVLNSRPHGPCFNTQVALEQVEEAVRALVKGE